MDSIGTLIDVCLVKKIKKNYWQIKLLSNYSKIVGKAIASNTKLVFFQGNQATILCRNSIWMNELKNMETDLIAKLNQFAGKNVIENISVKIGNIDKHKSKTEAPKKILLSDTEQQWVLETKKLVPLSLQNRFESVLIAYKELKK